MSGRNFDGLSLRFKNNIYGTRKGQIRLDLLWHHLQEVLLPRLEAESGKLHVFDAGCGLAQISKRLGDRGYHLTLCDKSAEMLELAREEMSGHKACEFIHASFQQLEAHYTDHFDLVLSHAVLEWLDTPAEAIQQLSRVCKPGAYLSLLFYNRDAYIFRNLMRGNWKKVESEEYAGDHGGLTPTDPVSPADVLRWLDDAGMECIDRIGLRTFFDYMPRDMQQNRDYEDILRLEQTYSRISPYRDMARYIHIIARKR